PYYQLHRVVLAMPGHPILKAGKLTLQTIVRYPMITYDSSFPGAEGIAAAFEQAGLRPPGVLSATAADPMKAHWEPRFGHAVVGEIAFDKRRDSDLRAIDARHLFPPNQIYAGLNRSGSLRGYMFDFIALLAPQLTRRVVEKALSAPERTTSKMVRRSAASSD